MKIHTIILLIFNMIGCAHHKDVRPGKKGKHTVITLANNINHAENEALDQAETFCDENDRYPVVIYQKNSIHTKKSKNEKVKHQAQKPIQVKIRFRCSKWGY